MHGDARGQADAIRTYIIGFSDMVVPLRAHHGLSVEGLSVVVEPGCRVSKYNKLHSVPRASLSWIGINFHTGQQAQMTLLKS